MMWKKRKEKSSWPHEAADIVFKKIKAPPGPHSKHSLSNVKVVQKQQNENNPLLV